MARKIGIIGFGNMGTAIAQRIKHKYRVYVFDKDSQKTADLTRITVTDSVISLVGQSDVIIFAVKPQDFDAVLGQIKDYIDDKLIISIAAGISTCHIESRLGMVRVIRVMPNLPARINEGMSCLCKGAFAQEKDLKFAEALFEKVGSTLLIKEDMMDAATAVSGSGPGFIYSLVDRKSGRNINDIQDALIAAFRTVARGVGFDTLQAKILANTTVRGSLHYWKQSKLTAGELKNCVASKGGTTEAGLLVLGDDINNLALAVDAAMKRAQELSRS